MPPGTLLMAQLYGILPIYGLTLLYVYIYAIGISTAVTIAVQYHNPDNAAAVADEGQQNASTEAPVNSPSTGASGDPKPPYTPLCVWVK